MSPTFNLICRGSSATGLQVTSPSWCGQLWPLGPLAAGRQLSPLSAAPLTRRRLSSLAAGMVAETLSRAHPEDAATPEEAARRRRGRMVVTIARARWASGIRGVAVMGCAVASYVL